MLKVKGGTKTFCANTNQKKADVAILISNKIGFKQEVHKDGHYITLYNDIRSDSTGRYDNPKCVYT